MNFGINNKSPQLRSINNSRTRKQQQQQSQKLIRTSHIVMGMLGCIFVGTIVLFGSSLHVVMRQQNDNNVNGNHEQHSLPSNNNNNNNKDHKNTRRAAISHSSNNLQQASTSVAAAAAAGGSSRTALDAVKNEFYERYGGKIAATALLDRTITTFGDIDATATRILRAVAKQTPFVMGFAGYSITVGRGNFFNQSFPFVVERVLKDTMQAVGVPSFIVRNSAIGGIPSFPYAYCLDHFVSRETDVLSWDFSMNEMAKDPAVFEAYLRQALHQLPKRPMIIMVDNNPLRTKMLEKYVQMGLLDGALTVAKADSVIDATLLQKPDEQKPRGLQQWDEFGAPARCPGKGSWHPKRKEHEFMGWMIAMHFVKALEKVHEIQQESPTSWQNHYAHAEDKGMVTFPDPISNPPAGNDASVTEILFGHKTGTNEYQMKQVSCRTNFLPATDHEKVLQSLVVTGINKRATADNIMDERSDEYYREGWVLDVSQVERDTKRKVEQCGGLGYIDMKIALYGIPESGTLGLFLPYEAEDHDHDHDMTSTEHTDAQHWFDGVIICEANDKRPKEACQLDHDIEYVVGAVKVESVSQVQGAGEYLKRRTCVSVGVPKGAKVNRRQILSGDGTTKESVGIDVQITAKNKVTRSDGACCISHVVWEQH